MWVDAEGQTHITEAESVPPEHREQSHDDIEELRSLWGDQITGPPVFTPPGATSADADRVVRELREALDDLARGETARASAALQAVLRAEPSRPEAHWYLALLDWQRGRLESSEAHLRAFLAAAGDRFGPWRESAQRRLNRLEDERRLLAPPEGALRLVLLESPNFRVQIDDALRAGGAPNFGGRVLRYLDEARGEVGARLGVFPEEPTGVVLYGKAAYVRAHSARFSFQTVGFFDGRIHVVSAAHPAGELRTLLFHEYTHAVFREQVGSDRPFWLNEGMAELSERASKGQRGLTRTERATLRRQEEAGRWIPLRRLGPSFGGLSDGEARLAYLEASAAAAWIDDHTDRAARAALIGLLGQGRSIDEALRSVLALDTDALDHAVRQELRQSF